MSFATKYRPKEFSDVIGQTSTTRILQRQLEAKEISHAYMFVGASGCGKTTIARIFADTLNESSNGRIELDAASNNGVDNVRQIIKDAKERSVVSKYKVYIIDECHALSSQAWQAFLKCIEEPPTYTIFIFCTTDPQKIPLTIQNRCQKYVITKLSDVEIYDRLLYICRQEKIEPIEESLKYICKLSDGSVRQAITFLEQAYNYAFNLNIENVIKALGSSFYEKYFVLVNAIIDQKLDEVSRVIEEAASVGVDLRIFINQFFSFCLDLTKFCIFHSIENIAIPSNYLSNIQNSTNFENAQKYYMYIVDKLLQLKSELKTETQIKDLIEASLLRIALWN